MRSAAWDARVCLIADPGPASNAAVLGELQLWLDPRPRDGPANMAVDEWLAATAGRPVLRCYRWQPGWGSLGYFIRTAELPANGLHWVRRWTGGGIVDHRSDWTYTLFVPRGEALAEARGAESYRTIHAALAGALRATGRPAALAGPAAPAIGGECFIQPVEHDLLDAAGRKIAGAGQRRSLRGLLHQGSLAGPAPAALAESLAARLGEGVTPFAGEPPADFIESLIARRYGAAAWLARR